MNSITLCGSILSLNNYDNVANILVVDKDSPKNTVFKVAIWGPESSSVMENLSKGDEISVSGMIYSVEHSRYGNYIDVRQCKLIKMIKIQRTEITTLNSDAAEEDSLPQEGE